MFNKFKLGFVVIVGFLCLMSLPVIAADRTATLGTPNSDGNYDVQIDSDHAIKYYGSQQTRIYQATTNTTIAAVSSGSIFLVDPSSTVPTFTLPTAAEGLNYKFVVTGHGATKIIVDPASTDTFVGCVVGTSATTFTAGDSITSAGTTGDSLSIVGASTKWYCTDRTSTWVDNN
jgi:hypothetical protein